MLLYHGVERTGPSDRGGFDQCDLRGRGVDQLCHVAVDLGKVTRVVEGGLGGVSSVRLFELEVRVDFGDDALGGGAVLTLKNVDISPPGGWNRN